VIRVRESMRDQIKKWKRDQKIMKSLNKKKSSKPKAEVIAKNKKTKMSTREVEELMGIRRPIYERRRGALRRK